MAVPHSASQTPSTIWTPICEDRFLRTVQEVRAVFAQVPGEACTHDQKSGRAYSEDRVLPYNLEYQLAQDIAFIAAHEEGVHTVSAATVEGQSTQQGLTFTIASNSGVGPSVREAILGIGRCLERCAQKKLPRPECTVIIFRSVVQLCEPRIIGRFKCKDWIPPAYHIKVRRPMQEDLEQVFNQYLSKPKKFTDQMMSLTSRLRYFINFMIRVNQPESTVTFQTRLEALQLAGSICEARQSLETALEQASVKVDATSIKAIRAFDKVANYQHISDRLSNLAGSSKFRHLFQSTRFRFLDSYAQHVVLGRDRFVHAEVQIVTFHRLEGTQPRPRAIGTTKAACYLCNLFLSFHPQYTISATHGTLFDAWTIPDVLPYSVEDRRELRAIVQNMQLALEARVGKEYHGFRPFPVQSGIYHVLSSPSLAETVIGPAASVESASVSTIRSMSKTQDVNERPSMDSFGEAVAFSVSDRDVVSSLTAASQKHCGHRALARKKHCKRKESRIQRQLEPSHDSTMSEQVNREILISDPGCRPRTKVLLKAGAESREVSECKGIFSGRNGGESKPPQMRCPSSIRIETPKWRKQQDQKDIEDSPHRDRGAGRTLMSYRSSDHADHPSSASEPAQKQPSPGRHRFRESGQETEEVLNERSPRRRKKRRRRRRKVQRHPDHRETYDVSRHLRDETYQGHRSQGHRSHASCRKSHYRSSGGKHSFLQSLWRAIRGVHRLFCL